MSPMNRFPAHHIASGKTRTLVTAAAAALIGTVVGGASVISVVVAVSAPPAHDMSSRIGPLSDNRADARSSGGVATAMAPQQAQAGQPSAATPPRIAPAGPLPTWPDALSMRTAETAPEKTSPQLAVASDQATENAAGGAMLEQSSKAAVALSDAQPSQMLPGTVAAKKRLVTAPLSLSANMAPAGQVPPSMPRGDARKLSSQPAPQQPDNAEQAANDARGHWGAGLFDFAGQGHWNEDHWNGDRWNSDHRDSRDW
jgi:hypothetical protein